MAPTPTYIENVGKSDESEIDNQRKRFPYIVEDVDQGTNQELLALFSGEKTGFLQVGPKKWFFHSGYRREAENYYNFKARPDDVFIITFPRSGTTWAQEMVWLLANDLDYEKAAKIPLNERFPFLEFSAFVHSKTKAMFLKENQFDTVKYNKIERIDYPAWKYFEERKERRFIKTHLPFSLLPPNLLDIGCKVIYIARNPKDVAVSYYHLNRSYRTQGYVGDFHKFWKLFQKGLVAWAPYWEHIKEGWSRRNENNSLFLFYEDMNQVDLLPAISKVSSFLGETYSEKDLRILEDHLRIDNFKKNKSVNSEDYEELGILASSEEKFVRKGVSGGWRNYFDDDLNAEADKWIAENLESFDIKFPVIK